MQWKNSSAWLTGSLAVLCLVGVVAIAASAPNLARRTGEQPAPLTNGAEAQRDTPVGREAGRSREVPSELMRELGPQQRRDDINAMRTLCPELWEMLALEDASLNEGDKAALARIVSNDTERAATSFYYKALPMALANGKDGPSSSSRWGNRPAEVIVGGIKPCSRFGELVRGYLVYDRLWRASWPDAKEGLWLFFRAPPEGSVPIPAEGAVPGTCADNLRAAVRDFTFQYDLKTDAELSAWWSAHKHEDRDVWARATVDAILHKGAVSDDDRHTIFKVTRNITAAEPSRFAEFRTWWSSIGKRTRSEWISSLMEKAIDRLASTDADTLEQARRQVDSILSFYTLIDVVGPEFVASLPANWDKDPSSLKKVQARYETWWKENKSRFRCGPYPTSAEAVWVLSNEAFRKSPSQGDSKGGPIERGHPRGVVLSGQH